MVIDNNVKDLLKSKNEDKSDGNCCNSQLMQLDITVKICLKH